MKSYRYQGFNQTGHKTSGIIQAADSTSGQVQLGQQGIFVTELTELTAGTNERQEVHSRNKIKQADLTVFVVQLAALIGAGLQLDRALEVLSNQKTGSCLGEVVKALLKEVRTGVTLSEAMAKQHKVFSELQIQMVHAGEISGHLELVLAKLAEYSEKEETRRAQLKSALTYPVILIALAIGAVGFIVSFVIPKMSKVFLDFGTKLPWTTQFLIGLSQFMAVAWPFILAIIAGGFLGLRWYHKTTAGGRVLDQFILGLPLLGPLMLEMSLARFSRTMAVTGSGGVGVMEALEVAAGAAGNRAVRQIIMDIRPEVREGNTLADSFKKRSIFPGVMVDMVAVGEETGNLEKMFTKVAELYDFKVDNGMRRLLSLLEPALIVLMGAMVAFIVVSVLVPITQLGMDL